MPGLVLRALFILQGRECGAIQMIFYENSHINKGLTLTKNSTFISQMKTVSVALVLCLNVGVDPPDIIKTSPCARKECWLGNYEIHMI